MLTLIEVKNERTFGAEGRRRGRPSDYREEYGDLARKYALLGLTNKRIADLLGVSESTFHQWMEYNPDLANKVHEGRDGADAELAEATWQRAKGYDRRKIVRKVVRVTNAKGEVVEERTELTETAEHYPGEPGLMIKILHLRHPEWRPASDERPLRISDLLALADAAEASERRYIDAFAEHGSDAATHPAEIDGDGESDTSLWGGDGEDSSGNPDGGILPAMQGEPGPVGEGGSEAVEGNS